MTADGGEETFLVYSDAGFAGADTKSQNGLVIIWAGSIITWRSSRAALSGLSTAEAELCAAALGWQVTEGVRYLLNTLYIFPGQIEVMIDNKAALTAASLGATWRTRYFAVQAQRLLEENQQGRAQLTHCHTKDMVADALTKLATASVIQVLVNAMDGCLPTRIIAHRTSVTPGPAYRGDIAGDGPSPNLTKISEDNASTHDIDRGSESTRLKKWLQSVEPWNPPIASLGNAMRSPSTSLWRKQPRSACCLKPWSGS